MRVILYMFVCDVILCSRAESKINWSTVKPNHIHPFLNFLQADDAQMHKIVGGAEVAPHSIPHQAALITQYENFTAFCGGSLISNRYILTAAHCVDNGKKVQVILGAHRLKEKEDTRVRLISKEFFCHPKWNRESAQNNIALVKLPSNVCYTDAIQRVKLPSHSDATQDYSGEDSFVSGWGKESDSAKSISETLRGTKTKIVPNWYCNIWYLGNIANTHICISGTNRKGACVGDSGGPLMVGDTQVGIASFVFALGCEAGWPSVYTRVTAYLKWIEEHSDVKIRK